MLKIRMNTLQFVNFVNSKKLQNSHIISEFIYYILFKRELKYMKFLRMWTRKLASEGKL